MPGDPPSVNKRSFCFDLGLFPRQLCRENPPGLAVVDDNLPKLTGIGFLNNLLKISWNSGTILIADHEESVVHEKAEGLGILGHMRGYDDFMALDDLLDKYSRIISGSD